MESRKVSLPPATSIKKLNSKLLSNLSLLYKICRWAYLRVVSNTNFVSFGQLLNNFLLVILSMLSKQRWANDDTKKILHKYFRYRCAWIDFTGFQTRFLALLYYHLDAGRQRKFQFHLETKTRQNVLSLFSWERGRGRITCWRHGYVPPIWAVFWPKIL